MSNKNWPSLNFNEAWVYTFMFIHPELKQRSQKFNLWMPTQQVLVLSTYLDTKSSNSFQVQEKVAFFANVIKNVGIVVVVIERWQNYFSKYFHFDQNFAQKSFRSSANVLIKVALSLNVIKHMGILWWSFNKS